MGLQLTPQTQKINVVSYFPDFQNEVNELSYFQNSKQHFILNTIMSLFRKPKKNIRNRIEIDNEDEDEQNVDEENQIQLNINKQKQRQKDKKKEKANKNADTKQKDTKKFGLSFDDDLEEEDVEFKVKKSKESRRLI